jgi:hypothetical protein
MRKSFYRRRSAAVATVGWLFADLLLALGMLFLISSPPRPKLPPVLIVRPAVLYPTSPQCKGGANEPQCQITIMESANSQGNTDWTVNSDMNNSVVFNPGKGVLSPGKSATVTVSAFPCQNGSFTFSGTGGASPVEVLWNCNPPPNDRILEHQYCQIKLNIGPAPTFITDSVHLARGIVEPQLNNVRFLQGRQIGIAIAYGGTIGGTEEQGTEVANQVYNVLKVLANDRGARTYSVLKTTSWYEPLFTGLQNASTAILNVYLVVRSDNPKDTCDAQHNPV